jgi:DNA-binding PadR family transcriptional regulator
MRRKYVGSLEEIILLAIQALGDQAYGVPIHECLRQAGRTISIGSLYVVLSRLEDKEYIKSSFGDPTAQRGGKAKKYYTLTGYGAEVLYEAKQARHIIEKRGRHGLAWIS